MNIRTLALASSVILAATTASFAQSLPNFGRRGTGTVTANRRAALFLRLVMGDMLMLLGHIGVVCTENLNPSVMMMKPAKNRV
jgi:hypothetical protein